MPNEDTLKDFLGGLESNETDFDFQEETPEVEPSQEPLQEEEKLPYHEDPKVQRYLQKQLDKRMADFEAKYQKPSDTVKPVEDDDDFYVRLIGNDTPEKVQLIKEMKNRDQKQLDMAEERAFNRLTEQQQQVFQEEKEAEDTLSSSLEDIEDTFGVNITSNAPAAAKLRTEFLEYVEKIAPKDRNGEIIAFPDMQAAFETFNERRQTTPNRTTQMAKEKASRSMGNTASATITGPQKRISFNDVDSLFEK